MFKRSAFLVLSAALVIACHREERPGATTAAEASRPLPVRVGELQPGPKMMPGTALNNPYEGNAFAINQGQQLFEQYNCSGCHAHGGGSIGPPLMDSDWIYGSSPANIYETITQGRPNGMPSFGGHIPDQQVWYLVTYVRALGGFEGKVATAARSDEMQSRVSEEPKPEKFSAGKPPAGSTLH